MTSKGPLIFLGILISGGFIIVALFAGLSSQNDSNVAGVANPNQDGSNLGERAAQNNRRIQVSIDNDPVLGSPDAPITLVEFSDFQCTFCTRFFFQTEPALKTKYIDTGKVKLVYKDLAINGRESTAAAEAGQCAHDQGKFWEYHDLLFSKRTGYNNGTFSKENLKLYAQEIGLNQDEFSSCVDSRKHENTVNADRGIASVVGARGTPTFFINGIVLVGAQPLHIFEQIIETELAQLGI